MCAVVDIGSNGVRFSISSKAAHHARVMPCVFKDRVGISLYEVQYAPDTLEKIPISSSIIQEICSAMKRFQLICDDFGVSQSSVRVVATEATREALNSQEFIQAIHESTGWEVEILTKELEGKIGIYGVISSFNTVSGLYLDMGGGTTQLSWIDCKNGEVITSSTPVLLPYGAGSLARRLKFESKVTLFEEIKNAFSDAIKTLQIPEDMWDKANKQGGFDLWTRGGGLRGMGHLLLADTKEYPIQTIINGFSCSFEEFSNMADYLFLKQALPGTNARRIFKVSDKRALQLPAVGLAMSAAFESLPKIKTIHFSEGGVREGTLYSILPREIRAQDPLIIASRPYAPLLADKYLFLLRTAMPENDVPDIVHKRIAPALCNLAFVHASYPKELQPTAALHVATSGIIAGCHGLSHITRTLIGIALCNRWGGNIPESEEHFMTLFEEVVLREGNKNEGKRIIWWTKYIGTIMYVICGVHPGGNIRDGVVDFCLTKNDDLGRGVQNISLQENVSTDEGKNKIRGFEVIVRISKDDLKTSASVRSRIITLQKKMRRLSRGSLEKAKVKVQFYED